MTEPGELTPRRRQLLDLSDDALFHARFLAALVFRDLAWHEAASQNEVGNAAFAAPILAPLAAWTWEDLPVEAQQRWLDRADDTARAELQALLAIITRLEGEP